MNTIHNYHRTLGRLGWLLFALAGVPGAGAAGIDVKLDLLQTKTGVYSNVTVTTTARDYIVIQHTRGLASVKVADLPSDIQKQLGYAASEAQSITASTAAAKATALVNAIPTKDLEQAWNKYAPAGLPPVKLSPGIMLAGLGLFVGLYLFFCYCGTLICQKTGKPAGPLIWVPVLQFIPLFRAADMSPAWFVAMLVPGLNVVAQIIWSFKIARARSQGLLTAILLILPTYPLAFMYLAFASGTPPVEEKAKPKKFTPTALTFDTA
jgi:hypothetical protein